MKKLIILTIAVVCMGCSDDCITNPESNYGGCPQPPGESCGFLKEWDTCECECDWIF